MVKDYGKFIVAKCRAFDCDLGCQIDVTHYYCEDIDECTTETDNCVPGEACVINEGVLDSMQ